MHRSLRRLTDEMWARSCRGQRGRRKIALVATAHHLVKIMLQMLKHEEAWREIEVQSTVKAAA